MVEILNPYQTSNIVVTQAQLSGVLVNADASSVSVSGSISVSAISAPVTSVPVTSGPPVSGSSVIAPAKGCLVGMYVKGNQKATITALGEQMGGVVFDIQKLYTDCTAVAQDPFWATRQDGRTWHVAAEADFWGGAGSVPASWPKPAKGGNHYTWTQVASGDLDKVWLIPLAQRLKAFNRPVIADYHHECDIWGNDGTTKGQAPTPAERANYQRALRHVIDVCDQHGATNVEWCLTFSGWNWHGNPQLFKDLYFDHPRVLWIGWDPYIHDTNTPPDPLPWLRGFHDFVRGGALGARAAKLPLLTGEYGVWSGMGSAARAAWFAKLPAALAQLPGYKAMEYWDSGNWGTLEPDTASIQALGNAYKAIQAAQR